MWCNYVKWICFCCSFLPYNVVFFNKAIFSYAQIRLSFLISQLGSPTIWENKFIRVRKVGSSLPIFVRFSQWAKLLTSQRFFCLFCASFVTLVLYLWANQCPTASAPRYGCGDITRFIQPNVSYACTASPSLLSSSLRRSKTKNVGKMQQLSYGGANSHPKTSFNVQLDQNICEQFSPAPGCYEVHPLVHVMHCMHPGLWEKMLDTKKLCSPQQKVAPASEAVPKRQVDCWLMSRGGKIGLSFKV